ncbi:MAG: hypothetical protein AAFY88_28115, partial [Acidobacteriota bacterium]
RAAELMQAALQERAREARRLPQWAYFDPYLPSYYYGVSQFESGRCDQALRAFESSEEQGVLLRFEDLFDRMVDYRLRCREQGEEAAEAGPGEDTERKVRVAELATSADKVVAAAAPLAKSEKDQERFKDTRTGLSIVKTADEEAERIGEMADGAPPSALDGAVQAFFGGDPGRALATLEGFVDEDPKVMAHVHLVRSAAAYRLFRLGHGRDGSLEARARRFAGEFKRVGAGVSPPQSLFGPSFLAFLATVEP